MRATLQRLKEIIRENENAAAARDEIVMAARDQIARCDELLQRINIRRRLEPDIRTVVERLGVKDFPTEDWGLGPWGHLPIATLALAPRLLRRPERAAGDAAPKRRSGAVGKMVRREESPFPRRTGQ